MLKLPQHIGSASIRQQIFNFFCMVWHAFKVSIGGSLFILSIHFSHHILRAIYFHCCYFASPKRVCFHQSFLLSGFYLFPVLFKLIALLPLFGISRLPYSQYFTTLAMLETACHELVLKRKCLVSALVYGTVSAVLHALCIFPTKFGVNKVASSS